MTGKGMWATLGAMAGLLVAGAALAQVPADLKPKIAAIGHVVNPAATADIYRSLHPRPPYPGVSVVRDVVYGPAARNLLDVVHPAATGPARPVLIFIAGGQGEKIGPLPDDPFYDNIMLWAVKNGMVGVNIMRQSGPGTAWDANAKDVGAVIAWVKANAARYGGDPNRVFIWAHSAGNGGLTTYLAHPEYYPAGGIGLKGAILMSGNFNILPLVIPPQPNSFAPGAGPNAPAAGPPPPPVDPAVQLQRSSLPGLKTLTLPVFMIAAELDPTDRVEMVRVLGDEMCKAGHCPERRVVPDHGHMSIAYSIGTADVSATAPLLTWMRGVK